MPLKPAASTGSPLLETSIQGARGIIVNITGPMDMDLEEVEAAANMVKDVAADDALFMMGAAFDEELEDELRVTVIATGFGEVENPVPGKEEPEQEAQKSAQKEDKPDIVPPGVGPVVPPVPLAEDEKSEPETDPFDDIFKIFNKK
jgi:cell division protein FtsZ